MQTLTKAQLKKMNDEQHRDFVLINVLPQKAFNERHIRTSINIPHELDDFTERVGRVAGSKDRDIVVYCASFDCQASPKAAKKLESAGFKHIYDYEGGSEDWFSGKESQAA